MRFRGFVYLSLLLAWLALASAFAGNEHEHLVYLPKYSDLVAGGFDPAKIETTTVGTGATFRRILGWEDSKALLNVSPLSRRLAGLGQFPPEKGVESLLSEYLKGRTLDELARDVAKLKKCSYQTAIRGFFELNELHSSGNRAAAYLAMGNLRTQVLNEMKWGVSKAFASYLKTTPSDSWRTLELSVPPSLYDRNTLLELRRIATEKGARVRFMMAVPREGWVDERGQRNLTRVRKSLEEGWGHGLDIVGSFSEVDAAPRDLAAVAAQRAKLEQLAGALSSKGVLRIHAFEGAREGAFYAGFWEFLERNAETGALPREIRIGHINALDPRDIERFKRIQKTSRQPLSFVFEASIESNLTVRPAGSREEALTRLRTTIERLHESGFKVVLGADGHGILGARSQFLNSLALLKNNRMRSSSVVRIIQDSSLLDSEKKTAMAALKLSLPRASGRKLTHCGFSPLLKGNVELLHAR